MDGTRRKVLFVAFVAAITDERADLDLQINLLIEHEMTKLLRLVVAMASSMKLPEAEDPELTELEQNVSPADVLQAIEEHRHRHRVRSGAESNLRELNSK